MDRILRGHGFRVLRQTGSHVIYDHPDGRGAVVPRHGSDIGRGLVRKILEEAGIDPGEVRR